MNLYLCYSPGVFVLPDVYLHKTNPPTHIHRTAEENITHKNGSCVWTESAAQLLSIIWLNKSIQFNFIHVASVT